MKRRSFVKTSILTATISSLAPAVGVALNVLNVQKKSPQEFYELRIYTLKNEVQQKLVENYFQNAFIPAYNRLGVQKVGVFSELKPTGQTKLYIIIPFKSVSDILKIQDKLAGDALYNEAGKDYLHAPAAEPAYERIEVSLLKAFAHMPVLEAGEKKSGLFELRRYESAGELAAKKKIEMFNTVGEIDIFKRVGLRPVFFGETVVGSFMPNLTYMLSFDSMAEHDRIWKLFGSDPEWKRISSIPEYADSKIVSRITSTFLIPTAFSQI
jgi:hypothetical protein